MESDIRKEFFESKGKVERAFARAPGILRQLEEAGVQWPFFKLHADGSGSLNLGENPTNAQYELAVKLVRSNRVKPCITCLMGKYEPDREPGHLHEMEISFCDGLMEEK